MTRIETIFGLVGRPASGKDYVAGILENEYGFIHVSSSDILRSLMRSEGIAINRANQTSYANSKRSLDSSYFVKLSIIAAVSQIRARSRADLVISGIYAPVEAQYIRRLGGSIIAICPMVDPEDEIYGIQQRILHRKDGQRDQLTLADLSTAIFRESSGVTPLEANVLDLIDGADYTILNEFNGPNAIKHQLKKVLHKQGGETCQV